MLNSLDLPGRPADTRVVVAMSGGVDSSVVAALLKEEGYDVTGITLQLYDHGAAIHRPGACCAGQDIDDAKAVARLIGIPHYVLNYESLFKATVIDRFADSYIAGETPIPCVECNQQIKFRDLLDAARDLGAAVLATGHYVASRATASGRALYRPRDADRDQSYFLFGTTGEQLGMLRFPLGDMTKAETRAAAARFGLGIADKPDSQDICFVPTGRYTDLVEKLRPNAAKPGEIIHVDGRVVGRHKGVIHYTVGQRKGLGVATGEALYVVRLEAENARVIVGPREALLTRALAIRDVNWLGDTPLTHLPAEGIDIAVRVRSTRAPKPARLRLEPNGLMIDLAAAEEGVSPGQAAVFYDEGTEQARVLGGGFIKTSLSHATAIKTCFSATI